MNAPLFDKSSEYDAMLAEGLKLSGETKDYFMRGRITDLKNHLPKNFKPTSILDYGCGIGETAVYLSEVFPTAKIHGVDTASGALEHAKKNFETKRISFSPVSELMQDGPYDLCYVNGVFHHIEPEKRLLALRMIYHSLASGGLLALFENNPWNPGTRLVMSRIAFDRDAKTLSAVQSKRLLAESSFNCLKTRFLFYFPRALRALRCLEPLGASIPLGGQYYILGQK